MKRRRKYLKQAGSEQEECQSFAQIVSDPIEIMDAKGENSLANFPLDLVIEILMRLPSKSLMRFKCVSKQWSSLICSRYFCTRLFTTVTRQQPRLYMCLVDEAGQQVLLSISSTSPDKHSFVVVDQDLSIPGMGGYYLNVARGLMCFSRRKKACIYNPSTKQLLTLPAVKSDIIAGKGQKKYHTRRYYVGHDHVSDQYKLFCTIGISFPSLAHSRAINTTEHWVFDHISEHWVFALEAGGSWKKVVPSENYHHHAPFPLGRSTSGSVVRYLAWLDNYECVVVSFDIRSEQLTTIPVPRRMAGDQIAPAFTMKADIIEYGGKIAIFHHTNLEEMSCAELWVLEDSGKNEWSSKTLLLQPSQRDIVKGIELFVKGITQDGKVILAPLNMNSGCYFLCYDLQSNDLTKVEIKGIPRLWLEKKVCYCDLNFMDETSDSIVYLET